MYVIISTAAKVREKDDSLYSARCSFAREAGVDGKNDSLLYSKAKEGIKKE
ncbi:hypothetical protein IC805_13195 [Geobacillus thermoleovorans]|uniref:hypothetical protein n=1 Tax=Geobacillus thermoleovorans TaxID=33941 RepID=UPI0013FE1CAA|nr:hypothetical protein [Geobacillus thermoleovorans]QNU20474.1 hypothetical protein IC805_13195 [Geobacillus thermoleovorans]